MLKLRRKERRRRALWPLALAIGLVGIVVHFSLMRGDTLIQTDYRMVRRLLPLLGPLYRAARPDFDGRIDASRIDAAAVESVAVGMENWIHTILFALLATGVLFALRRAGLRPLVNCLVTGVCCALYAYFSEVHQMNIHQRIYEWRDVRNNLIGIGVGEALFAIRLLARRARRANRRTVSFEHLKKAR